MSTEQDCDDVESTASGTLNSVVEEVRQFTVQRLDAGLSPSALSFALAFVATEMGLCLTRDASPLPVFQVVLQAMTSATMNAAQTELVEPHEAEPASVPVGAAVH